MSSNAVGESLSVGQTLDSGYFIGGYIDSVGGQQDFYLIKTDINGNPLWYKTYGRSSYDNPTTIIQTYDGGYLIAGKTLNLSNPAIVYAILIKTDSNGDTLWSKLYSDTISSVGMNSVVQANDSGFVAIGGNSFGRYILKTNVNGNIILNKLFGGSDLLLSLEKTNDGGFIVAGVSSNSNYNDVFILKLDSALNPTWSKKYGGIYNDYANCIKQTPDSGYIIVGSSQVTHFGDYNIYIIRTDINGDTLWTKNYDKNLGNDYAYSVEPQSDGSFVIDGETHYSTYSGIFLKIDSGGNIVWSYNFNQALTCRTNIKRCNDGGFIVGCNTFFPVGSSAYLIKTDSNGQSNCYQNSIILNEVSMLTSVTSVPVTLAANNIDVTPTQLSIVNGGTFTTLCSTVQINETNSNDNFEIYPNPNSSGLLNIVLNKIITKAVVEIYNVFGNKVLEQNMYQESNLKINLKNISSGIYFVKVFDGEKSYCKKLIVEHD